MPEYQAKNRKAYLAELPARIQTARAVSNGTEKPGAEFKTEEELLEERIKKEKRWRRELQGWRLIRPGSSITWDDQMQDKLRVFLPAIDAEQQQQSKRDS